MTFAELPQNLKPVGAHPATGEPLTEIVSLERLTDVIDVRFGPPPKPTRELWDCDDDGNEFYVRDLTEDEYRRLTTAWSKSCNEWIQNQGTYKYPGVTRTNGKFATESGAWVEGEWEGDGKWFWFRWSMG